MRAFFILLFGLSIGAGCKPKVDPSCVEAVPTSGCACGYILQPVCGCNGKTYSNPCLAECVGIINYTPGECNR
ncbi:protease inhibitor Kazal-type [Spirosoma knui]